ncbi:MAG: hypothetical protein JWP94_2199 [Mucilaginibacter sp.]|nr:hypothetical protein [Mucilaginibacter sp.]
MKPFRQGGIMKRRKNIEQRTFLQDRFEILIKKQKKGTATFLELTELDDIVNRYAVIRDTILDEMRDVDGHSDGMIENDIQYVPKKPAAGLLDYVKSLFRWLVGLIVFDLKLFLLYNKYRLFVG